MTLEKKGVPNYYLIYKSLGDLVAYKITYKGVSGVLLRSVHVTRGSFLGTERRGRRHVEFL